jgi:glycosyltransferase involved in cell wall biosynthesis
LESQVARRPEAAGAPGVDRPLRIALLTYRGNPYCGGQGVYTRQLSRALTRLGHRVEVLSGQPYPVIDPGVDFTPVPSLDLYRQPDPFRIPHWREFRDPVDLLEFGVMCTAGFPEPLTFSLRAWRMLRGRAGDFDLVHDNQCLGYGVLAIARDCAPVITTIHHPITVDRTLDLAHAPTLRRRFSLQRWYGFTRMQVRVARRMRRIITPSETSRRDIAAAFDIPESRMVVVTLGVDTDAFHPVPSVERVPGRILTTASADVPLKGLGNLIHALALLRSTHRDAHLVVIGRPREESRTMRLIRDLNLLGAVQFRSGLGEEQIAELYAECEIAVVPSLYEGFSLPAVEAMASGVPLVATRGGALPDVVGEDGETGLLVDTGDPHALRAALVRLLDDELLRHRLAAAGRRRALERFSWDATARATADEYLSFLSRC